MSEQAAAGWYPQPGGVERYWDGSTWTDQVKAAEVARSGSAVTYVPAKTNHVLHLILSVVTLGAWLPFWLTVAIVNSGKYVPQATYTTG